MMFHFNALGAFVLAVGLCRGAVVPDISGGDVNPESYKGSTFSPGYANVCGEVGGEYSGWGARFEKYPSSGQNVTYVVGWSGNWYSHWVLFGLDFTYSDGSHTMVGQVSMKRDFCDLRNETITKASIYYWRGRDVLGVKLETASGIPCSLGATDDAYDAQVQECVLTDELGTGTLVGMQGRADPPIYRLGLGFQH